MNAALLQVHWGPGQAIRIERPAGLSAGFAVRLAALEAFATRACGWLQQWGHTQGCFGVQLHDEDPQLPCFRFDAPLGQDGGGPLIPDPYALASGGFAAVRQQLAGLPSWQERLPLAIWRGSSTGLPCLRPDNVGQLPRYRLCQLSQQAPLLLDARLTAVVQAAPAASVTTLLRQQGLLGPRLEPLHLALHRWLLEIDGNVNSWGLLWKLLSGSCVVRVASSRRQWYHHRLVPWRHVVPVRSDLSDLLEQLQWCQQHPDQCASIAAAGRKLALEVVDALEQDQMLAVRRYAERWQ